MKLRLKKLNVFVIISILIVGCETCDDCGPVNNYPYFNLSIFNETDLRIFQKDSSRYAEALESIDNNLENLRDSLNGLEPDASEIIDQIEAEITTLEIQDSLYQDSLHLKLNKISDIRDRLISIESINDVSDLFLPEEGESDSASSFRIPLNTASNQSDYKIKIRYSDILKEFSVSYTLEDTVINNRITKTAKNLQIVDNKSDSIRGPFGCSPIVNCSSNQLDIYVKI